MTSHIHNKEGYCQKSVSPFFQVLLRIQIVPGLRIDRTPAGTIDPTIILISTIREIAFTPSEANSVYIVIIHVLELLNRGIVLFGIRS